jgi:hypothetical protein
MRAVPEAEHVGDEAGCGSFGIARREAKRYAVVGRHNVPLIGQRGDQRREEG